MAGIDVPPLPVYSQLDPPEPRTLSPFAQQQLQERLIPEARELVALARQCLIDVRAGGIRVQGTVGPLPVDLTIKIANL